MLLLTIDNDKLNAAASMSGDATQKIACCRQFDGNQALYSINQIVTSRIKLCLAETMELTHMLTQIT